MKALTLNLSITSQRISLEKKIKLENQKILENIEEINEDIDISEHEVHKFLLIFHTVVETINSEEAGEETDGFATDAILQIVNIIAGLLKNNIDSLNILAVLKSALKKLKSLFIPQTKDTEESKTGEEKPENGENSNETQETSETGGDGVKKTMTNGNKKQTL